MDFPLPGSLSRLVMRALERMLPFSVRPLPPHGRRSPVFGHVDRLTANVQMIRSEAAVSRYGSVCELFAARATHRRRSSWDVVEGCIGLRPPLIWDECIGGATTGAACNNFALRAALVNLFRKGVRLGVVKSPGPASRALIAWGPGTRAVPPSPGRGLPSAAGRTR